MSKFALPCIVCGKPLQNVDEDVDNQPWVGTEFQSRGHYGSTAHDQCGEDDPVFLVLNVCDTCLQRKMLAGVVQGRRARTISLSRQPVSEDQMAHTTTQNYKTYGAIYGEDQMPTQDQIDWYEKTWGKLFHFIQHGADFGTLRRVDAGLAERVEGKGVME